MQYPLISEYVAAIREAKDNLAELAYLVPVLDDHGEPYRSSGAFAVVFKMKDEQTGKCYALKCFTEEQEGRAEAYRQIAEELEFVDSPYITSVRYLDKELFVDSNCEDEEFPVLLMDWVEGETMEAYIATHHTDTYAMSMLCYRFCKLAAWLRSQPFAHGDIKPDNIMVRPDGTLALIDYDGMFVPAMKGCKSPTIGAKDFSHPLRTIDDFDESIDDFALASIALSLKAISINPTLYDEYGVSNRLLFSANDYLDLSKSKVMTALQGLLTDEDMKTLMSLFLLASAKKNLSMCSFRAFCINTPNDSDAILKYGKNYCVGWDGCNINREKSVSLFMKALNMGNAKANWCLGCCYKNGYGVNKNIEKSSFYYKEAFKNYLVTAKKGNAEAQWRLGCCLYLGRGAERNYRAAVNWIKEAAEQGYLEGSYHDANSYNLCLDINQNLEEAIVWNRKLAEQNNSESQWKIGLCYYLGHGVEKDYEKAAYWYKKSAEQNDNEGQFRLGLCYYLGRGLEKNCNEAVFLFEKSAEQGNPLAQCYLGICYYDGKGVAQNYNEAVNWFKKSAMQGEERAQYGLAVCYFWGRGLQINNEEGLKWLRKSANAGLICAQYLLGLAYEEGIGIPQNLSEAVEWFQKAADKGHVEAKRHLLNLQIDDDDLI